MSPVYVKCSPSFTSFSIDIYFFSRSVVHWLDLFKFALIKNKTKKNVMFDWALQISYLSNLFNGKLSPESYWLGPRSQGVSEGELYIYIYIYIYILTASLSPPELFCIQMGSDESHFNVGVVVWGKVTRQCPRTTTSEEKGERKQVIEPTSSAYQPNSFPLGQTGPQFSAVGY